MPLHEPSLGPEVPGETFTIFPDSVFSLID